MARSAKIKGGRATEKDVLMGRGKRVSEWPGNIYFRQIVNGHRDDYSGAERSKKVNVAEAVIADLHDIGGRFLKEEPDGSWTEIELARSIEKTCQALREKEKPNPKFEGFTGRMDGPAPAKQKAAGKRKKRDADDSDNESVTGSTTASHEDSEDGSDSDDSSLETETEDEGDDDSQPGGSAPKIPSWDNEDMMTLLDNFKRSYGNCAVPPGWTKDEELADWAAAQRQLYREVITGYRDATVIEKKHIKDLDVIGFVWDYDQWHWNLKFQGLSEWYEELLGKEKTGEKVRPAELEPSKDLVEWLQDQQRQHTEARWQVPVDRMEKLRKLGASF